MTRICLDRRDINALQRDGLGWGHDLDSGCMHVDGGVSRRGALIRRLRATLSRKER